MYVFVLFSGKRESISDLCSSAICSLSYLPFLFKLATTTTTTTLRHPFIPSANIHLKLVDYKHFRFIFYCIRVLLLFIMILCVCFIWSRFGFSIGIESLFFVCFSFLFGWCMPFLANKILHVKCL